MSIICPKCGRDESKVRFIDAFCVDCYPIRVEAPTKFGFKLCKSCGMMFLKGEWMPYNAKKVEKQIASKCKGDFTDATYDMDRQAVKFLIVKGDNKIETERFVRLDKTVTTCPRCSRISGGYFEAIIQIRGEQNKAQKLAATMIKRLEKLTFIAKTDEKDEGVDIYIGDSKAAVSLMAEMGYRTLITKKLVGQDEGKQLYRTTFLVRL
jgi:nonsense-mediated mRNA decay protein 3